MVMEPSTMIEALIQDTEGVFCPKADWRNEAENARRMLSSKTRYLTRLFEVNGMLEERGFFQVAMPSTSMFVA